MEGQSERDEPTQTTADGLTRLAKSVVQLLGEGVIDSRLAAKILRRLDKEAALVAENGPEVLDKAQKHSLRDALGDLERSLHDADASTLVKANAKLRSTDEHARKKVKSKG